MRTIIFAIVMAGALLAFVLGSTGGGPIHSSALRESLMNGGLVFAGWLCGVLTLRLYSAWKSRSGAD